MCHITNDFTNVFIWKSWIHGLGLLVYSREQSAERSRHNKLHATELHKHHHSKEQVTKKFNRSWGWAVFLTTKSTNQTKNKNLLPVCQLMETNEWCNNFL